MGGIVFVENAKLVRRKVLPFEHGPGALAHMAAVILVNQRQGVRADQLTFFAGGG